MATASVTNTFVNGQTADADEVNTNFTNLITFLNASVVHVDGSKSMSAALAMGSNKITGLAAGTATGNAARWDEIDKYVTFSISGELELHSTTPYTHRWYPPYAITIEDMKLSCGVAPTGAAVIVDVNKDGTTLFTTQGNRPTVAAAGFVDTVAVPDVTSVLASNYLTIEVDQIGSTLPGEDMVLTIRFRAA